MKSQPAKDMCPVHNRKLEVIWVDDQIRICTNCALFGEHKNHNIREEQELLQEITLRAELLLDIYQLIEQNKNNLGDQKDIDNLYNQFMTKQIALKKHVTNKFKEYSNELLRKEKSVLNILEGNFDSIEKTFEEIKNGPKKVMELADTWCQEVQEKMERFNNPTSWMSIGEGQDYISFEMLEDQNNEKDIIRIGEKVLEDLDKQIQPPIPQLQDKLKKLTVQFDEHFNNKLEMLCHVPNLVFEGEKLAKTKISTASPQNLIPQLSPVKKIESPIAKPVAIKKRSIEKNLLEDDDNLLTSFDIPPKMDGEDNLISAQTDESINFWMTIPDPVENSPIDTYSGNTDAAYDVISEALENQRDTLDLSNRKLGDEFFVSMIESIVDFADGDPLSIVNLNISGNDITDFGCEKLWEFLIVNNDGAAAHIANVDFSNNRIKDKSVDILETLCMENIELKSINLSKNKFRTLQVINRFKEIKDKKIIL